MRALCLIAWICAPHSTSPGATLPYREKDYRVEHYEAELAPDVPTRSLRGNVSLRIVSAAASLPVVAVDADELVIEHAVEDGHPLAVEITPGLAHIRLTRPAPRGEERTIRIWYHAQPKRGMWFLPGGWWYTGFHTEAWLPE
jgi:aminopeptidase N